MGFQMSLRFRIISLMMLFTLIIIAAVSTLIINRQLDVIASNNKYRARIGTFAAKGAFERTLQTTARAGDPPAEFQKLIPILREGQLAEDVMVADLNGKVVSANREYLVGTELSGQESQWSEYALQSFTPKRWFYAQVSGNDILFFAPIALGGVPDYVAIFRYSLGNMREAIKQSRQLCAVVALGVLFTIIPLCLLLIRSIIHPLRLLNDATHDIAAGNLGRKVEVPTQDELGELAETFNQMTSALVDMKKKAEGANPLTKLPGNNAIHEAIEERLTSGKPFVAVYSDLDNFKAFNDKYGIGAGDEAIKLTAQISREALAKGNPSDFLGHEGGDDFFILTTPDKVDAVVEHLGTEFDKRVRAFYSEEDQAQGYIMSKDRENNIKKFPIMTISLAGVTNAHRTLESYAEITNICAEVKKKAKILSKEQGKSSFFMDRRTGDEIPPESTDGTATDTASA